MLELPENVDSALATAEETPCPYLPILYRRALPLTRCTSLTSLATPVAQLLITVVLPILPRFTTCCLSVLSFVGLF